jgi:1,2-diacylglycerol 3-alpha-glucosyltransferase
MKIAFFANSYFPITYGSTVSIENFRVGLEKLGHEVHIFVPRFWGYKYEIEHIHLYPSVMFGYKIKYPLAILNFSKITKEAELLDFDIIHAQHPFSVGCEGMKIAKKKNIPLIFTHHAKYEEYSHYIPPIIPQKIVKSIISKRVTNFANQADICISPSKTIEEYMRERKIITQIEILPTGIAWKNFQRGDRGATRKKLGIKEGQKVVMFLGRIENEKNIIFLVQEILPILKNNQNIKFLLVGGGSLVPEIKKLAKKEDVLSQLIFTGIVKQSEVVDFYAVADVFLHASLTETQGMTIAEAMSAGLPIVAIEASGVVDQLENQKTGIMIKKEKGLFKKEVEKIIIDEDRARELGKAAKEKSKEFDNSIRVKQLEKIYKEAIKNKKSKLLSK